MLQFLMLLAIVFFAVKLAPYVRAAVSHGQALVVAYRAATRAYRARLQPAPASLPLGTSSLTRVMAREAAARHTDPWAATELDPMASPRRITRDTSRDSAPIAVNLTPAQAAGVLLFLDSETRLGRDGRGVNKYDVRRLHEASDAVRAGRVTPHVLNVASHLATRYRRQIVNAPAGSFSRHVATA